MAILFAPSWEPANRKFFLPSARGRILFSMAFVQMDPAIFKEGFYQGKLVDGIVQCPANGFLGQYVLVLGFHPLLESIEAWFYILLATQQFLLWTKSVFPVFPLLGIPVRYLPQGIFCRAVTLDITLEGTKLILMSTLAPTFAIIE